MWSSGRSHSLENWCLGQGADVESRELFASLTPDEQDRIRSRGTLKKDNPSRCLQGRIREIRPGWIEKTPRVFAPRNVAVKGDIAVLIRGEAFRLGGWGTNESGLPAEQWSYIVESIANRLVLPLQTQGYNV